MKCPKCGYLGFETGDRCKNCGYDFSLLAPSRPADDPELTLRSDSESPEGHSIWLDRMSFSTAEPDTTVFDPPLAPAAAPDRLPLFAPPTEEDDDQPLVRVPRVPRAPLAVRRAPEATRLRAAGKSVQQRQPEPELEFVEEVPLHTDASRSASRRSRAVIRRTSGSVRRIVAVLIDYAILLSIDAVVIYFTLRMSGLYLDDWRLLPPGPMIMFLALIKFAYFWAFTAAGGQSIGKMAMDIYVVPAEDGVEMDGGRACRRTLAGILSVLTLGLGFIPALFGSERRALHDHLAHTRVVRPPSV
jgi:uncharacterized RDD family membrane protein YckC